MSLRRNCAPEYRGMSHWSRLEEGGRHSARLNLWMWTPFKPLVEEFIVSRAVLRMLCETYTEAWYHMNMKKTYQRDNRKRHTPARRATLEAQKHNFKIVRSTILKRRLLLKIKRLFYHCILYCAHCENGNNNIVIYFYYIVIIVLLIYVHCIHCPEIPV